MKTKQIIIWASFAIFMLTSIVIAGTVGLIDVGLDKVTQDKATVIIGEKKISEEQFVKESVEVNVQQYEKEKLIETRMALNQEMRKCLQSNDLTHIEACKTALINVNKGYEITEEIKP